MAWCVKLVRYNPYNATVLKSGLKNRSDALAFAASYTADRPGYERTNAARWRAAGEPDVVASAYDPSPTFGVLSDGKANR
jgi:hypothetical protein